MNLTVFQIADSIAYGNRFNQFGDCPYIYEGSTFYYMANDGELERALDVYGDTCVFQVRRRYVIRRD